MKRPLLSFIFAMSFFCSSAQLQIQNTQTAQELVLNSFLGENISVSNVKFNGSTAAAQAIRDQVGKYSNGAGALGSEQGLLLTTGKVFVAAGPNNSASLSSVTATPFSGDADLALISGSAVRNVCNLEFDFIPNGDTVFFEYIFASEEYPEFANSSFNDTFALLLSGPGISGPFGDNAQNIALIPGNSQPVSINNLNNGTSNSGPCENCAYYVSNGTGNTPLVNTAMQYDGRSTILTARGTVVAGSTYHLKFILGNIGDNLYDSALFLVGESLRSATLGTDNFESETVNVFPNPAHDFIEFSSEMSLAQVKFYDMQGRMLKQLMIQNESRIVVAELQSGTYIVEFVSRNEKIYRQKLMVK